MKSWRMVSWHIFELTAVCSGRERCYCISITGCSFKHRACLYTDSPCYQRSCAESWSWLSSLCLVWQQGQWYQKVWLSMLCLLLALNSSPVLSLCWSVPLMLSAGPGPTDWFISLEMFWGGHCAACLEIGSINLPLHRIYGAAYRGRMSKHLESQECTWF